MKRLRAVRRLPGLVLVSLVRLYQRTLSRLLPSTCRFEPSCSEYMIQAVQLHGALKGAALGIWRILRCNPFCAGGYDPVPPARGHRRAKDEAVGPESESRN